MRDTPRQFVRSRRDPWLVLTAVLAVYGAALSTATLIVGGLTWWRSTRTHVKVRLLPRALAQAHQPTEQIVLFDMINDSHHEVAITHVSVQRGRSKDYLFFPRPFPVHEPVPIVIAARRAKSVWVMRETLEPYAGERLRALVQTDDGHDFRSGFIRLSDE